MTTRDGDKKKQLGIRFFCGIVHCVVLLCCGGDKTLRDSKFYVSEVYLDQAELDSLLQKKCRYLDRAVCLIHFYKKTGWNL